MLKGKWALVTGATAGLGLAVAESLAGAGANIVLHDLNEPAQTRDRLRAQFGIEVVGIAADLSQRAAIEAAMADLLGRVGAIDILVNNAVVRHFSPVEHFPPERWDEALAVNLSAPFHLIRLALPGMKERRDRLPIALVACESPEPSDAPDLAFIDEALQRIRHRFLLTRRLRPAYRYFPNPIPTTIRRKPRLCPSRRDAARRSTRTP